jgi:D-alanyl-D-alanine carboxypeptidase (penicillin-binding protein 5/6)
VRAGEDSPAARAALVAACALLALAALVGPARAHAAAPQPPKLDAAAWILVDPRDGTELAAKRERQQRAIASTTKLMTAYVGLQELKPSDKLKVPPYSPLPAESVAGLTQGERLTFHDLLLAMMLPSANDAAETVAVGVGGSEDAFVDRMNDAAADLGLDDTSYSNPIGLDEPGNYSTAQDLATLAEDLLDDKRFRRVVATPEADLTSGAMTRHVVTRNTLMLSDPSVDGVKTGHTLDAGYVLVASAKRHGIPLLSVVLGASSEATRDSESEQLLDYGFSLYRKRKPFAPGKELASATVKYEDQPLSLASDGTVEVRARADQELETRVDAPDDVEGPIAEGERLGTATVTLDGDVVGRVPLVAAAAVAAPSWVDRIGGPGVVAAIALGALVILIALVLMVRRRGNGSSRGDGGRRSAQERHRSRLERRRRREEQGGAR